MYYTMFVNPLSLPLRFLRLTQEAQRVTGQRTVRILAEKTFQQGDRTVWLLQLLQGNPRRLQKCVLTFGGASG
jgi:hypothetical protein